MEKQVEKLFIDTFNKTPDKIERMSAHGSNRQYFRITAGDMSCIGVYNHDVSENKAFLSYARQLKANNINVPDIYAKDTTGKVYLQQDLGDQTLFSYIKTHGQQDVSEQYARVVKQLPKIQTIKNFDYTYAYPRKDFDGQSIQWDLNYFKYYFLKLAGIPFNEEDLEKDFNTLKSFLLTADTSFFLYRDFQSRNIMLKDGKVWFIDFQGGRKGALQYDIASLLYDAKADIPHDMRQYLFDLYFEELQKYVKVPKQQFEQLYYAYVYIRIMQAMGSYGYRGYFEGKTEFLKSIPFALNNLKYLENNVKFDLNIPALHGVFDRIIASDKLAALSSGKKKLTVRVKSFSYKIGYPHDVSGNGGGFVFDCRALPNPGREDRYKQMTGLDKEVKQYLEQYKEVDFFFDNAMNLVSQSVDNYLKRGFSDLSVYFGCTGGRHRSVYLAARCADLLSQNPDLNVIINHVEQNI